jgi:hypothetical protein
MRKKNRPPTPIQNVVQGLIKNWGLDRVSKEQKVFTIWREAIGDPLYNHTRPVAVHHGRLVIAVKDNAWMQELQLMKREIKKKLNKTLGKGVIKEIRFKIGSWEDEDEPGVSMDGHDDEIKLDPAVIEEAEAAASVIADPQLREQILKALLSSARREFREKKP